jgi:hypothetical protein
MHVMLLATDGHLGLWRRGFCPAKGGENGTDTSARAVNVRRRQPVARSIDGSTDRARVAVDLLRARRSNRQFPPIHPSVPSDVTCIDTSTPYYEATVQLGFLERFISWLAGRRWTG